MAGKACSIEEELENIKDAIKLHIYKLVGIWGKFGAKGLVK